MGKRNPNGYGCITKLKGSRSRPYVVRVTVHDADGFGRQVALDYAETWEEASLILAEYNNNPWDVGRNRVTLADVYRQWEKVRMPKLGKSLQRALSAAYGHCAKYYGVKYRSIRAYQMQDTIDNCGCGYSTQGAIRNLWGHLDRFAFEMDIIDKMYSELTTAPPVPETSREPFTPEQVDALWAIADRPWVDTVLIFLYTGFRLGELLDMRREQVNTEEWYFRGGEKTAAGKNRIVPVHERIRPLVEARHTFETMLDNARGNRKCIDMLMGHKSQDIGNRVYNHKTIDQLRETVALLK